MGHRLSICGVWAALVEAGVFRCSVACGILVPRPGIKPASPALEGGFLTTGPPGKLLLLILDILNIVFPLCHSIFVPQCPQLKEIFIFFNLEEDNIFLFYNFPFRQTCRYVLSESSDSETHSGLGGQVCRYCFNEFNDKDNLVLFMFREFENG